MMARGLATRRIGKTDIEVTELGFGGAPLGAVGSRLTDADVSEIITRARAGGIRYFDTAPLYGHGLSEKRLGGSLQALDRDDFVLSTKIGRLLVGLEEGERDQLMRDQEPVAVRYDYSYDAVHRSIEASLERLGLDRIDIALCHDIDVWTHGEDQPAIFDTAIKGALRALRDLREQGVVRAIGLGVNEWLVCSRVMDIVDVDCFLLAGRFTLLEQEPLDQFLPKCLNRNVSIIIGGPYNSGILATDERRFATYDYKPAPDDLFERAQRIRRTCEAHGVDPRAAALQYPLRHRAVAAVIPGVRSAAEVEQNLALVATEIPASLWSDLEEQQLVRAID